MNITSVLPYNVGSRKKPDIQITGNSYIYKIMTDIVEIPTPNSRISMTMSLIYGYPNDCDNDRLSEIARLAPKMSI